MFITEITVTVVRSR